MFAWDYTFLILLPPLILAIYAQAKVKGAFNKYSRISASRRRPAAEIAEEILKTAGAGNVRVEKGSGRLTDHYDPRTKIVRLSEDVYNSPSIAAYGIAAHEAGHAIQHHTGYVPLHVRSAFYPIANLGSTLAFPLFFIGFIFSREGPSVLMDIGILLYAAAVAFTVITLPVEFNASKRALTILQEQQFLTANEMGGARQVLKAAALTYVASTAMAAMQLVRMLFLRQSRH